MEKEKDSENDKLKHMELSKLKRVGQRQILYPPVVIAHITKDVMDLFAPRVKDKSKVQIHYSTQMNSYPHLGTVLSLMTAFAIGKRLQMTFDMPVRLKFEVLENAPGETKIANELTYTKMLSDIIIENESLSGWAFISILLYSHFFSPDIIWSNHLGRIDIKIIFFSFAKENKVILSFN